MKIDLTPILALAMKERFEYLRINKESLICSKKSTPHVYEMKESYFGDISTKDMTKAQRLKSVTVLVFDTNIKRSYNEKMFNMYNAEGVNQHSIGLQYVNIMLAVNDPEDKEHYKNWTANIDLAINKEKAIDNGFFFLVKEYKLIENSAVLFGANELTPTLEVTKLDYDNSRVKVVANAAYWIDEQLDMLFPGAPSKSIKERKKMIPHLHDHIYTSDAKIGEVVDIYEETIDLNKYIKAASVAPLKEPQDNALNLDYIFSKL